MLAVQGKHAKIVERLLREGANRDVQDEVRVRDDGAYLMQLSTSYLIIVHISVTLGVVGQNEMTALMLACAEERCHLELVKALVNAGADKNLVNKVSV
jgi:hypothetical protein